MDNNQKGPAEDLNQELENVPKTPTESMIPKRTSPPPGPKRMTYQELMDSLTPEEKERRAQRIAAAKSTSLSAKLRLSGL